MERYISLPLLHDLNRKPILLSGPRQCGKTFLSQTLIPHSTEYLSYDIPKDRKVLLKQDWRRNCDLVIFDEIHKMKKWKLWLKGIFDSSEEKQMFLVTGSAKLNTFKKTGDSLAGRYLSYRLYPFDLKEIMELSKSSLFKEKYPYFFKDFINQNDFFLNRLLLCSGFPEPFLINEDGYYQRWQQTHLDVILRQDILDTESIKNIKQIETLTYLLTDRTGVPLSYNSLREDLGTDDKSVKRWVDILENSYVVFRIYPYVSKSLSNAIKKAPKLYFYDYCRVENWAARLENFVAFSLLKEIHYRRDVKGETFDLRYLRNKQQREIDFLILRKNKPYMLIEVKESEDTPSENFKIFESYLPEVKKIQLVKNLKEEKLSKSGVLIAPMRNWLTNMNFE